MYFVIKSAFFSYYYKYSYCTF